MKAMALAVLVVSAPQAWGAELDCSGTLTTQSGEKLSPFRHIVLVDEPHATIKTFSPSGEAYGKIEESQEDYKGYVAAETGPTYWLYLNRYTGSLMLMLDKAVVYNGDCTPTVRRF